MTAANALAGSGGCVDIVGLRVAAGSGRLVRRPHALLFLPEPSEAGDSGDGGSGVGGLVIAFESSGDGEELRALARATVGAEFAVPAYVAAVWGPTVTVMAFGDVNVQTDQASLPLLAAGASSTWVEHTLFEPTERVTIDVEPPNDSDTNLVAGHVPAGGFRLELVMGELPAADVAPGEAAPHEEDQGSFLDGLSPPPPPLVAEPEPAAMIEPIGDQRANGSATSAVPPDATPFTPPVPAAPSTLTPPVAAGDSAALRTDYTLPPSGLDDPQQMLAAIQGAAVGAEDEPDALSSHTPDADIAPESAGVPAAPSILFDAPTGELHAPAVSVMVEGRRCELGHGSPPGLAACQVCGAMLHPATSPVEQVQRSPLGDLVLDDGTRFPLERDYIIGRRPGADSGFVGIEIEGDKVSRQHLTISLHDWSIVVTDMGSTNGTYYLPTIGGELERLADAPTELNTGAVLYVGSRTFTIEPHNATP